jgi:N-acetylglucosamine-6-sulfatase
MTALGRCGMAVAALCAVIGLSTPSGSAVSSAVSSTTSEPRRPNIVVIMVDDMRRDELRYMPATTRLVGQAGVTFRNALTPDPLCCPSRASFLTGLYAHNHRVFDIVPPWGFTAFDDRSTLATWLHDAGYRTTYLGKYLNGYGEMPPPGATEGASTSYVPPGWDSWRAALDGGLPAGDPMRGSTYEMFDTTLSEDGLGFESLAGRYQTRAFGDISERIIRASARSARPFLFFASYVAPHNARPLEVDDPGVVTRDDGESVRFGTPARPHVVRGRFDEAISDVPARAWNDVDMSDRPAYLRDAPPFNTAELDAILESARQRAEALWVVDRQVKRTVEALSDTGLLEDTYVVFTSDNGYFLGEQRIRSGKVLPHDPSIRVPLLIRGPDVPGGQHRNDPFTSVDVAPTLASLAGITPPVPVDGVSLAGVVRRGDKGWVRGVLTESAPLEGLVRDTDESGGPLEDGEEPDVRSLLGVRTARYLYVDVATGERELYDMVVDPQQTDNVAGEPSYARVQALLAEVLAELRSCDAAECRVPLPPALVVGP